MIGLKCNAEEKAAIERVARDRGHASVADCLRAAFNQYASEG